VHPQTSAVREVGHHHPHCHIEHRDRPIVHLELGNLSHGELYDLRKQIFAWKGKGAFLFGAVAVAASFDFPGINRGVRRVTTAD